MVGGTLVTVVLWSAVCSQGTSQTRACTKIAPTAPISEIGAFSNMRYTAEHAYGETVLLWRAGECAFGLFKWSRGLQGDTPIGELQDVAYNPRTGALKFSARLTATIIGGPSTPTQPSRDLFTFDGILGTEGLAGRLTHSTQVDPNGRVGTVRLKPSPIDAEFMHGSATYGAWRGKWEPILKVRGPKW